MSKSEIDAYLNELDEPKRETLEQLRQTILAIVPDAEQGMSYKVPAFRLEGKTIAGFAAFKNHLSYLPHSGRVISKLADATESYTKPKVPCTSRSTSRCLTTWSDSCWTSGWRRRLAESDSRVWRRAIAGA